MTRTAALIAAIVLLGVLAGGAPAAAQAPGQVRLSLLEAAAGPASRSCTLEVLVNTTDGTATLSCERKAPPVSHLGAHRALTASEAERLNALAAASSESRPRTVEGSSPASADSSKVTITIERGGQRVIVDASGGPEALPAHDRETLCALRRIADELRGTGGPSC